NFRCSSLLLQRFGQIVGALAQFIEEPRVLDGDDSLVGEGRRQLDLLFSKGIHFIARQRENTALRPDRGSMTGRVALEGRPIHIPDVLADPEYQNIGYQKIFGYRTDLGVPLLREGTTRRRIA